MDYIKLLVSVNPFEDWVCDILSAKLAEIGFESFVETQGGIEAFIPKKKFSSTHLIPVFSEFGEKFEITCKTETIPSQNWNEVWEKNYFQPLLIDNCLVRAPFHTNYPEAEYEIIIEPNMAFGTGNHETTSLVIEKILKMNILNKSVLDMGCGTGILGILASMKGAKKITAIDIDEWSFSGTRENAELNQIKNIEIKLGDATLLGSENYDVIFANIHKNVLLSDLHKYNSVLKNNGTIIMSGFYTEDISEIKAKAESLGLTDSGFTSKNNWVAYQFQKAR